MSEWFTFDNAFPSLDTIIYVRKKENESLSVFYFLGFLDGAQLPCIRNNKGNVVVISKEYEWSYV